VVSVNLEIALRFNRQIEMTMTGNLREHVIEERNTGVDAVFARTIKIQTHTDIGFVGLP
jgi:hypothetical protein